jgi:hypothetical protein
MAGDLVSEVVTFGDHHGQRSPKIVKDSGAKREGGLKV